MAAKGQAKSGGRKRGTPNRATAAKAKAIAESGLTPLDYMISIMRNESLEEDKRLDAAKAAAPYVHPRLASVDNRVTAEVEMALKPSEKFPGLKSIKPEGEDK